MMFVGRLIVCILFSGTVVANGSVDDGTVGLQQLGTKIQGELSTAEGMIKKELRGHPKIVKEEMQFLKQAEDAAQSMRTGSLVEVEKAENQQKAVTQNLQNLHASSEQMEQQRSQEMASQMQAERSFGKAERELSKDGENIISEFGKVEDTVAQAFAGKDTKAVKTAMHVGELLEEARNHQKQVTQLNAEQAAKSEKKASDLAAALAKKSLAQTSAESKTEQEEHAYEQGMAQLVKDDKSTLSDFSSAKTAIAKAFAGKDSKAVETAMEAGELLDKARNFQERVSEQDARDAADAPRLFHELHKDVKEASLAKAALVQTSAESKTEQEEHAYATGMAQLAKDDKATLSEFSTAKTAIAKAFAGKGSKAVETAMEAGELLDKARNFQERVSEQDAKDAADAPRLFQELDKKVEQVVSHPAKADFLQSEVQSSSATQASLQSKLESMEKAQVSRLMSLGQRENGVLQKTEHAEDVITQTLARDGSQAAMATEHEVIAMMEKAKHAEEASYKATKKAVHEAEARTGFLQSQAQSVTEAHLISHSQVESSTASAASLQSKLKSMEAMRVSHLVSLGRSENGILHKTEHAEDAITQALAKDGSQAAMTTEHEVIAMMEKAKNAEEASYKATEQAVHEAETRVSASLAI